MWWAAEEFELVGPLGTRIWPPVQKEHGWIVWIAEFQCGQRPGMIRYHYLTESRTIAVTIVVDLTKLILQQRIVLQCASAVSSDVVVCTACSAELVLTLPSAHAARLGGERRVRLRCVCAARVLQHCGAVRSGMNRRAYMQSC